MFKRTLFLATFVAAVLHFGIAQQVSDLGYDPPIPNPAYEQGKGPHVAIDGGHHNFHTAEGRYQPFARLLSRDGYRVTGTTSSFSAESLKNTDVLVIANALNAVNDDGHWSLPTPSAFAPEEIAAITKWVESGGALFLIADHMPFPGAAGDLARAFGVEFSNGFAVPMDTGNGGTIIFTPTSGLNAGPWTQGRSAAEKVDSVATFTGSAFYPGPEAEPILVFPAGYISLTPEVAWEFKSYTPKIPIAGWCQGAAIKKGKGRVVVFGEAAMFTAQLAGPQKTQMGMNSPRAKQNFQFLLNVMHWLTARN